MHDQKLLRIKDVLALVPVSRRQIYRLIQRGEFPKPIKLSPTRATNSPVAWLSSDISEFINSCIAKSRLSSLETTASPEPAEV